MEKEIENKDEYTHIDKYDQKLTDHDYDGIRELDNPSPTWVVLMFMATICFSLIYAIHYFGFPGVGNDQENEYKKEMVVAEKEREEIKNNAIANGTTLTAEQMKAEGKKLYAEKGCIACHGASGEGNAIGPNLTDDAWINGCTIEQIENVITEGRPEKGMTPYKSGMTESQIKYLAEFIKSSMHGTNPANAKVAQGLECK